MARIFVIDDDPMMRRRLAALIEREADLVTCGEGSSLGEARQRVAEADPDLVLMGLSLEDSHDLARIRPLQKEHPDLAFIVLSSGDETLYAEQALKAGARGYLMKAKVKAELIGAIRKVLKGRLYLSHDMDALLLSRLVGASSGFRFLHERLSVRERKIFEKIGQGKTMGEIAETLEVSVDTVESDRVRIKEKLDIDTNARLRQRATIWTDDYSLH